MLVVSRDRFGAGKELQDRVAFLAIGSEGFCPIGLVDQRLEKVARCELPNDGVGKAAAQTGNRSQQFFVPRDEPYPIEHGTAQAQHDLLGLKLRDALVRTRVNLINAVRFTLKSLGHVVCNPSSEAFHKTVLADVPAECLPVVQPLLLVLTHVTEKIKAMERDLVQRGKRDYPVTQRLQQIAGVGPLTALCFVLKIGDPQRFSRGRDVGAYLGLCPRRDQSGGTDKQLRISKCGDGLMRRLLVSAAHYVLGPFGPACALREHGQRLTGTGSAREKKRAVVAVARKLAVLLLSLWKYGTDYS